jgi:hypothetical protein
MNTGQIIKSKSTDRYTTIPNEIIKSTHLKMAEKGFLCYLLSLPADWVIYKVNLYKNLPDPKGTIDTLFKSLQDKGYIVSVRIVNLETGKFIGWNHIVYDEPTDIDFHRSRDLPISVSTEVGESAPILSTNTILNTNILVNNNTKEKKPLLSEVISYFLEKGSTEERAKQAYEYYDAANWHDSRGKIVKNWKQKMLANWINNNNFTKTTKNETTKRSNLDYYKDAYEQSIEWAKKWDDQR